MGLQYFTLVHVLISLVGIAAGFGFLAGLIASKLLPRWTAVFLATTMATSVTGFFFPYQGVTPGIVVGVISVIALAIACYALYIQRLKGGWRRTFVITTVLSLYLNTFVLIVQLFQKIPALHDIAPTPADPASAVSQLIMLVVFVVLGIAAVKKFEV